MDQQGTAREALGVIELSGLVRAHRVLDAMVKRSPAQILRAEAVSGGKFLLFVGGGVAEVEEAMKGGLAHTGPFLVGDLLLPLPHPQIWEALEGKNALDPIDALGLLESHSVVDAILGADVALKAADVSLAHLALAKGIGGRAYFVVAGAQHDVEAALEAALDEVRLELLVEHDIITAPHDEMTLAVLGVPTIHLKY